MGDHVRFWSKVRKTDTCWIWTSAIIPSGYGTFWIDGGTQYAHRLAYEWVVGPIAPGLQLDHLCRVRECVRPDHLEPVTGRVNILRGVGPAAINARKTHCPQGHPLSGDNLYARVDRHGSRLRTCIKCVNARGRRYRCRKRKDPATRVETPGPEV